MAGKCPNRSTTERGTPLYLLADDLSADGRGESGTVFEYEDTDGYVCYTEEETEARENPFQFPCNSGDYVDDDGRAGCGKTGTAAGSAAAAALAATLAVTVGIYDAIYSGLGNLDEHGFLESPIFDKSIDIETASTYIQDGDVGVFYEWLELEDGTQAARYYAVTNNIGPTISTNPMDSSYTEIKVTLDSAENLKLQARFGNIEGGDASAIIATKLDEMGQEIIGASVENRDSFKIITTKPFSQKNLSTLGKDTESGTTITGITSTSTTMGGSY